MFKTILVFFALVIAGMLYLHQSLQDGTVLKYMDEHPEKEWVPRATFILGQGYYLFQDLPEATTYFWRVAQRYPKTGVGEEGDYYYLQCLDESVSVPKSEVLAGYMDYLEKYPRGEHADIVQSRADTYRTTGSIK